MMTCVSSLRVPSGTLRALETKMSMARQVTITCDICKKPCKKIVAKLNFIPMISGVNRAVHSNYTHHCDVGECCQTRLLKSFNFRKRLTAAEYHESRKEIGR